MKRLLSIVFISLAFTACAHTKKTRKHKKHHSAAAGSAITQIRFGRSACFGRCPQYDITINSSGLVEYKGLRFTKHDGTFEKQLSKESVQGLFRDFDSYRVDTCSSKYEKHIADVPGMGFIITRGTAVQQINNANFGPAFLKTLAVEVDNLAAVDESWKQTAEAPVQPANPNQR